jgi:hypothetical protein
MFIWNASDGGNYFFHMTGNINSDSSVEFVSIIAFDPGFTATSILHPATYLNKVVVASSQGGMQLWNILTR